MTAHMAALLWDLACPSVPCDDRDSENFGGTASLCPGESSPCLLFSSSHDGEGLDSMPPLSTAGFR